MSISENCRYQTLIILSQYIDQWNAIIAARDLSEITKNEQKVLRVAALTITTINDSLKLEKSKQEK